MTRPLTMRSDPSDGRTYPHMHDPFPDSRLFRWRSIVTLPTVLDPIEIRSPDIHLLDMDSLEILLFPIALCICSSRVWALAFCLSGVGRSAWFPVRLRCRRVPCPFLLRCPTAGGASHLAILAVPFDVPLPSPRMFLRLTSGWLSKFDPLIRPTEMTTRILTQTRSPSAEAETQPQTTEHGAAKPGAALFGATEKARECASSIPTENRTQGREASSPRLQAGVPVARSATTLGQLGF